MTFLIFRGSWQVTSHCTWFSDINKLKFLIYLTLFYDLYLDQLIR